MSIDIKFPKKLENNYSGYKELIDFYYKLHNYEFKDINIDFSDTRWIDANLSAVIGSIFDRISSANSIYLINVKPELKTILSKNEFLSYYGYGKLLDSYQTTIKYRKFKTEETRYFTDYVYDELFTKEGIPAMSTLFKKAIVRSLLEIFENARIHGKCSNVYTCGQYFPSYKLLDFTIVDLGKTIKQSVSNFSKQDITGIQAIRWAVKKNTTTKIGISGGLGLDITREFSQKNGGKIQIISADGYWEQNSIDGIICEEFSNNFPGTVVNLEINVADTNNYQLKDELNDFSVF